MRAGRIYFLFFVILALPGWASAQQGSAVEKKTDSKSAPTVPAKPKENWGVLNDLKTGLAPIASFELQSDEQPGYTLHLIRVQWRLNDPIDLWVARPKATGKVPVVLYLYSYTDVNDRFHDKGWCERATAGGFAAVGFVSALSDYRYRARPMKEWFISELAESLGSSVHDVQLILNYLASRDDMDTDRVGMFGMGSGASIAILAAQADPRIETLDLLDPWGDWPDWLHESPVVPDDERAKYLTPEFLKSVATLDPVTYLPALKTRNLRVQQILTEPATPQSAKERIAGAVPDPKEVVRYGNAGDLLKEWQTAGLSGWIKQQLQMKAAKSDRKAAGETVGHDSEKD
jgi:acetyl esterase/lipase